MPLFAQKMGAGNTARDSAFCTAALLALCATEIYGTLGALAFIIAALSLALFDPADAMRGLIRFSPLLILPLVALLSTLWSDAPERTLRAALQLSLTAIAAILICRRFRSDSMLLVLFLGFFAIVCLSLPAVPDAVSHGFALAAPFESKNQLGFAAQMLLALALALAADSRQLRGARIAALLALPLCLLVLVLSQSAGARVTAALTLVTFPAFLVLARVKITTRILIVLATLVAVGLALFFLADIQAAVADFRTSVLKKDVTLTGRTYLWEFAARLSAERPLLGHGYYAFWRKGNIDAEGLWRWGGIGARSGFNFHNAFIEMRVDLGVVGETILIINCVGIAVVGFLKQLSKPSIPMAFLLSMLTVIYVRSFTESGLIGPFSLLTLLWISTAVYAFAPAGTFSETSRNAARDKVNLERARLNPRRT